MTKEAQRLRSDAERNRQRILEIAQEVFAAQGVSVRVEEIARRAGVGVGTIYRHFPTKEALFQAILIDRLERVVAQAERLEDAEDPAVALFGLIDRWVAEGAVKKDLVNALGGAGSMTASAEAVKRRLRRAFGHLLARAQAARAVREEVDLADILSLVRGILTDPDASARSRARRVAILCDGLRRR